MWGTKRILFLKVCFPFQCAFLNQTLQSATEAGGCQFLIGVLIRRQRAQECSGIGIGSHYSLLAVGGGLLSLSSSSSILKTLLVDDTSNNTNKLLSILICPVITMNPCTLYNTLTCCPTKVTLHTDLDSFLTDTMLS